MLLRLAFLGAAVASGLARPVPTIPEPRLELDRVQDVFTGLLSVDEPNAKGEVQVAMRCVDNLVRGWVRVVSVNKTFPGFDKLDFTINGKSADFPVISVTGERSR